MSQRGALQGRPVRGESQVMMTACGVRRLRGRRCRCSADVAKADACALDCRFSRVRVIHSRMTVRRTLDIRISSRSHQAARRSGSACDLRADSAQPHWCTMPCEPHHQHCACSEEIRQPVKRRLERVKRAPPPIDQRGVILRGRTAAIGSRSGSQEAAPLQFEHQFDAPRAGHDDALLRRAACQRDHRLENPVAGGQFNRRHHVTCSRSPSRATGRVSAGLHDAGAFGVNIFRTGYEFESAERHAA
jgi:hypothetical protein